MQHHRPGYACSAGRLCIFAAHKRWVINGWPLLEAVFQTDRDRRWIHFVPEFRVLPSLRQVAAEELGEARSPLPASASPEAREKLRLAGERRRALLQFRHSFPPEISRRVGRIPNEQWQILRLLRREKRTLDLLAINPALVFSLAIAARNEAQFCLPPDLGELRQRELAFYLKFPESEAVVRILRKIPPEALSEDRLNRLRNAVASPEVLKALSHVGILSAAVIALTTEPLLFASVTPSFLAEVTQDDGAAEGEGVVVLLRESLQMRAQIEPGRSVRVDSLPRLHRLHDELLRDYARWVEARIEASKFPPPPVPGLPGVVEPVYSAEQLVLEGRQQSNCVASYAPRVREGRVFIYRVLQPERATLSLIRTETGRWEIGELKASRNRPVTEQTHDLVEQWLGDWQLSCETAL